HRHDSALCDQERGDAKEQRRVDGRAPRLPHGFDRDHDKDYDKEGLGEKLQQRGRTHTARPSRVARRSSRTKCSFVIPFFDSVAASASSICTVWLNRTRSALAPEAATAQATPSNRS